MISEDQVAALRKIDQPVLVTGGGGFLGLAIVRQLIELGLSARSLSTAALSGKEGGADVPKACARMRKTVFCIISEHSYTGD